MSRRIPRVVPQDRIFKGDRWTRTIGSRVLEGAVVKVVKFCFRRRVIIEYQGEQIMTMLWCLKKIGQ
jgi:hypothetical protein